MTEICGDDDEEAAAPVPAPAAVAAAARAIDEMERMNRAEGPNVCESH